MVPQIVILPMPSLRLVAFAALALFPSLLPAQSGNNSFRGIYESIVVPNSRDIVFLASQNSNVLCLEFDYTQRQVRTGRFSVNSAGQFDFTIRNANAAVPVRQVTGTLTESGFSGTVGGTAFSGTRSVLTGRSGALQGGYSGWIWDSVGGGLGVVEWILAPSGKTYVYFQQPQSNGSTLTDGGTGSTATNGTFTFRSVIDLFNYVNASPSGSSTDGRTTVVNSVLNTIFRTPSGGFQYVSATKENAGVRLENVSTRGFVGTGDNALIGGFVVTGGAKRVVIRALGPSLTAFGVSGALANPTLEIRSSSALLATNDDWQTHANSAQVTAAGLAPTNASESAVALTLERGSYTAIVRGNGATTGVAIIEVYELD